MATGGFKLSFAAAKGKPGFRAAAEQQPKRKRLALDDDEPEDTNVQQEITGWDAAEGGAVDANAKEEPKGPRVIPALPNRDWREEAQKRQLARAGGAPPPPATASSNGGENVAQPEPPKMAFGLTTFDKKEDAQEGEPMDVDSDTKPADTRTEEEKLQAEAFEALINGKAKDETVIPISEEEAFENDMREAPDAPNLAEYEATPVEGFGAALLRGMGWKDGESLSKDKKPAAKIKELKKRPALLGIGAKAEAAAGFELGEWAGPKKGGKKAVQYNPVALKNKHTGELVTEEELKERLAKRDQDAAKAAQNNTFVGDDEEEDDRRREKRRARKEKDRRDGEYEGERRREKSRRDDEYDSERRRDKSYRDDRKRDRDDEYADRDRDRRRDKKYSGYEDSDRDRRRDKKYRDDDDAHDDRRREKRREKESRRDRSRSPYDDDRRERRRERDRRERSVDSKDRREKRRERSRSRDADDRRRNKRDHGYEDEKDDRRSKYRDDKYSRR